MHSLKDVTHSKKKKSQCYILPLAAIQADGHASSKLHEFFYMSQKQKIIFSFFYCEVYQCFSREPDLCTKGCEFKFWQEQQENFLLQS